MKRFFAARPALSWAFYDWANSAYATTVTAGFFPVFFGLYWSLGVDPTVTTARLGWANGAAGLFVALLAPLLGAIADRGGHRKRFLLVWTLIGATACAGLAFVGKGDWQVAALLLVIGTMGFAGGVAFNDALLLDVAKPGEYDRVSSLGYALGYLGGGLLFAINVVMVLKPALFGLADAAAAIRWSFITVAVWWILFTLPLMYGVRETPPLERRGFWPSVVGGLAELRRTAAHIRQYRSMAIFLVAYWLYIDAVNTVVVMAVDYGRAVGLDSNKLLAALLLTQFVAFPSAIVYGRLGGRIGARRAVLIGIAVYVALTIWAYFLRSTTQFFAMAVVLGLVQGGVQSLSRSIFGRLVPEGKSAEFFGFYNVVGKFGTIFGPILMGAVALSTGSSRASILSLVLLFGAGGILLLFVKDQPATERATGTGQAAGSSR